MLDDPAAVDAAVATAWRLLTSSVLWWRPPPEAVLKSAILSLTDFMLCSSWRRRWCGFSRLDVELADDFRLNSCCCC